MRCHGDGGRDLGRRANGRWGERCAGAWSEPPLSEQSQSTGVGCTCRVELRVKCACCYPGVVGDVQELQAAAAAPPPYGRRRGGLQLFEDTATGPGAGAALALPPRAHPLQQLLHSAPCCAAVPLPLPLTQAHNIGRPSSTPSPHTPIRPNTCTLKPSSTGASATVCCLGVPIHRHLHPLSTNRAFITSIQPTDNFYMYPSRSTY
ncbi:hypothetical protein LSTR_LSTR011504 [Laodelphax striatellus]|uniref:Uncharacterized protein n=1 Tax=Laodelphax striatellus TaxID=195883 RepID=A0A482WG22_LAOST|nr:hypothetical protein LSTR_LSTR011504 [Laodelphax striatellus]